MQDNYIQINSNKPNQRIIANSILQIPIQHIKGQQLTRAIFVPEYKIIISQGYYRQFVVYKIVDNKIEYCENANQIIEEQQQVIINFKQQLIFAIDGDTMVKLSLPDFNVIEKIKLDFLFYKRIQYIIQDDLQINNNFLIFAHMQLQFRRMRDLKLKYQQIWIQIPTNIQINKYCYSYIAKNDFYIHSNLKGKMIRKMIGPFSSDLKNFDSILIRPSRYVNKEHCTEIINPNSMRVICQLQAKQGQYKDSILIQEKKTLIILNRQNIMAYDTNNYKLLDEVQLPNYGIPYKLNYHNSVGIQIFYEIQNQKYKKQMTNQRIFFC